MNILKKFLIKFPFFEVLIRNLYWRIGIVNKLIKFLNKKEKKSIDEYKINHQKTDSFFSQFWSQNINSEELVVLHSSLSNLCKSGIDKNRFTHLLIEKTKNQRLTIVAPTFPLFRNELKGLKRFGNPSLDPKKFIFDCKSKRISTGLLGKEIIKDKDCIRSKIPINNLSAIGPLADKLFEKENEYFKSPYPCGIYSPWQRLYELNALIIFFDVNPAHTCTIIHYLEDSNPDLWPIKNWYRERNFMIQKNEKFETFKTFERHPKWSMSYCENILLRDLVANKVIKIKNISGIDISTCYARNFIDFLKIKNKNRKFYPYFMPFLSCI